MSKFLALAENVSTVGQREAPNATEVVFPTAHARQGIVYDKWPLRLDIAVEYQDWMLIGVSFFLLSMWLLPCLCGRSKNACAQGFTTWVYTRLHIFFCLVTYFNLLVLMCVVDVMPDWTADAYFQYLYKFMVWILVHTEKIIRSCAILFGLFLMIKLRDRLAVAAGIEHVALFRLDWREAVGLRGRKRPIEIFIWKVEELQSSAGKVLKANDVFVECHHGNNEPVRTRVHNNAGAGCHIGESFQLNFDDSRTDNMMTLLVRDQALVLSSELAKLTLSTREVCGIEDRTGKRKTTFTYSEDSFVALNMMPRGKIWLAIAPVEDGDEEQKPLMQEDSLVTCT
eukprot:TRINITY_DN15062_c0_g1_i1.p1 TRINITY_DN15062_c0_g1~~TRINITY_DN15062_c0_g1_i1.p1  ORF type:complete len:340 (+),score=65.14 TRINITY_DN15062_c0_g1_i1:156-1175(+)